MIDLKIKIGQTVLNSPVIGASGCSGWGPELMEYNEQSIIGGFVTKSVTLNEKIGNDTPRIKEVSSGLLNSIGLENGGLNDFIENKLPLLKNIDCAKFINLAPFTNEEINIMINKLEMESGIDGYEVNISCPNVHKNGFNINSSIKESTELIKGIRKLTKKALILKLSPAFNESFEIANIAEMEGFDGITFTNTYLGTAVNIDTGKFIFKNKVAGLSGPAIKPISLWNVYKMSNTVKIPIIGVGGIRTVEDVIEFMMIGASAIQIGTALLIEPTILTDISNKLKEYCIENHIEKIRNIISTINGKKNEY